MILKKLKLTNFRNFADAELEFSEGIQILHGNNGQGKTNLLESIYFLAITKSFRTTKEKNLLRHNQSHFEIKGFLEKGEKNLRVRAYWDGEHGKNFSLNDYPVSGLQNYVGTIPVVLLVPEDLSVTKGAPAERRRFVNVVLGQADGKYLHDLIQYRKLLRNKNIALQEENINTVLVEAFTQQLAILADNICRKRLKFTEWLNEKLPELYAGMSGGTEEMKVRYRPYNFDPGSESYQTKWPETAGRELEKRRNLLGPHLDDFIIYLNGKQIKYFGSQGENKTAVIALKLAEYFYLFASNNERPLMLFDDIFGELDKGRIDNMLSMLGEMAQVFVTTASPDFFANLSVPAAVNRYRITAGSVLEENNAENR